MNTALEMNATRRRMADAMREREARAEADAAKEIKASLDVVLAARDAAVRRNERHEIAKTIRVGIEDPRVTEAQRNTPMGQAFAKLAAILEKS